MLIEQPPIWFRKLYPQAIWRVNPEEKAVYLTFDDGPIPVVTPWVLDLLDQYGAKATFFMVGDNIRKYPNEFRMVVKRGHRIGNLMAQEYMKEVCQEESLQHALYPLLFRPPHGHMGWSQYRALRNHYKIIMWDLVTRDYSKKLNGSQVFSNVKRYVRNGSIITFHDSLKSWNNGNLQYALPRAIEFLQVQGYTFKLL